MEERNITVNIEKLIENFHVTTADMKEGAIEIRNQITKALVGAVRDFEFETNDTKEELKVEFTVSMPKIEYFETLEDAEKHIQELKEKHGDDVHIVQSFVVGSFTSTSSV